MIKKANELQIGDVLHFYDERDDVAYTAIVEHVESVIAGPLFNPQTAIQAVLLFEGETETTTTEYHPDREFDVNVENFGLVD